MSKRRYEIDLRVFVPDRDTDVRGLHNISKDDLHALAALMLDAYVGTIDYDDEGYEDAVVEVEGYLAGTPLLDYSFAIAIDGELASAVLVRLEEGQPFISYVMTRATHKGEGLARLLTNRALATLMDAGHEGVVLYITEGNLPSEALFRSLGAKPVPDAG